MGFITCLDANDELQTVHMDKKIRGLKLDSISNEFKYGVKL